MDTQRLILFVIFSFSALFLWERWQAAHQPPPAPTSVAKPGTDMPASAPSSSVPAVSAPNLPATAAPAPAAGEKIAIKTDRYVASVDTLGLLLTAHVTPANGHLLLGGFSFGLGMVLAGGCISGQLYRLGEGSLVAGASSGFAHQSSSPNSSKQRAHSPPSEWCLI